MLCHIHDMTSIFISNTPTGLVAMSLRDAFHPVGRSTNPFCGEQADLVRAGKQRMRREKCSKY